MSFYSCLLRLGALALCDTLLAAACSMQDDGASRCNEQLARRNLGVARLGSGESGCSRNGL